MNLKLSNKWIIALLTVILPLLLLIVSLLMNSGICTVMVILIWISMMMILAFIPFYKESA